MKHYIEQTIFSVINAIPNPVIVIRNNTIQSANNSFLKFFALSSIHEFNNTYDSLASLFIEKDGFFCLSDIKDNEVWTEYLFQRPEIRRIVSIKNNDKKVIDFEITLKKIDNESEYIIVFNDISKYIFEKNEYAYFAYHDHLTKIFNRQKFDELFLKELENKKRYEDTFSVILIDLDRFKLVNDNYGHYTGDLILIAIVELIRKKLRINDIFARWGGEEFIILLPRTDINGAYIKAEELRQDIESYKNSELPPVTISAGVVEIQSYDNIDTAFQRVDKALYLAKKKRNYVVQVI